MNRYFTQLVLFALLCMASNVSATQIPLDQAREYAKVAFGLKSTQNFRSIEDVKIKNHYEKKTYNDQPAYYIFNLAPQGFVVISAEDSYNPVLAFSDESNFDITKTTINESFFNTLGDHERKIGYLRREGILPPQHVKKEWKVLKDFKAEDFANRNPEGMVVPPLTTTRWNQGEFYNAFTPQDSDPDAAAGGSGTYCGCAPIAMSQLIKFHNYPENGNGNITYDDPTYGKQEADFCNTTYNWANMPDSLTGPNDDVAQFIYHVGASTRTEFSTVYTSTFVSYVRDALVNMFKYDEAASWFYDANGEFADVAIDDLNQGRPVLLTGDATTGGAHAWITDGYGYFLDPGPDQADTYFHFNWGWGGDNNGWFLDTGGSWAPIPDYDQPGTYFITYYYNRYVVHNVFPSTEECPAPKAGFTSGVGPIGAYLHYSESSIDFDELVEYRYKKATESAWTTLGQTTDNYLRANNLASDTDYEFQVRRVCCTDTWSDWGVSTYFRTEESTTGGGNPDVDCSNFVNSNLTTSNITESFAYIYTTSPYGDVPNQFRYRFVGSPIWSFTDIVSNYYRGLSNLEGGTEYEFQVRHQCSAGDWSDFTASQTFKTVGNTACNVILDSDLFTSSITENNSYIYSSQPYGKVDNEFRYRAMGTTDWTITSQSDSYYRYLSGLAPGTEYEFQVHHLCQNSVWSVWSFSHTFTTQGGTTSACDDINGDRLYFSSVTQSNAYVYTPQPFGNVANQFRYRPVGATTWVNTTVSTLYYRYLRDLTSDTEYEYQVSHECNVGEWTEWSTSKTFRTLLGLAGPGNPGFILPPFESPDFDVSMLTQTEINVFPNPTTQYISLKSNKAFSQEGQLRVLDLTGQEIRKIDLSEGQFLQQLFVGDLNSGLYLLEYKDSYELSVNRFFKN